MNTFLNERMVIHMSNEDVKWTRSFIEDLNRRCKENGMPQFIIEGNMVYKDKLHKILGIGVKLEEEA